MEQSLPSTPTQSSSAEQSSGKLSQESETQRVAKSLNPTSQSQEKLPSVFKQTWLAPAQGLPKHSLTSSQEPTAFLENPSSQGALQPNSPAPEFVLVGL